MPETRIAPLARWLVVSALLALPIGCGSPSGTDAGDDRGAVADQVSPSDVGTDAVDDRAARDAAVNDVATVDDAAAHGDAARDESSPGFDVANDEGAGWLMPDVGLEAGDAANSDVAAPDDVIDECTSGDPCPLADPCHIGRWLCSATPTCVDLGPAPDGTACAPGGTCTAGSCVVCSPESDAAFCARLGAACGSLSGTDNCGVARTVADCGPCPAPTTCAGAGVANQCGCSPETDAEFCARLGNDCGMVTGQDNCGTARTVASCGTCARGQSCGVTGVENVCGSYTEPLGNICTPEGWCWKNPLPQGNDLTAVAASAPNNVWAIGGLATVLHWDGTRWTGSSALFRNNTTFRGVWTSGPSDVWVVGYSSTNTGFAMHWDGMAWTTKSPAVNQRLNGVWGDAPNHVWAVGEGGTLLLWNGTAWSSVASGTTGNLPAIHGSAANDVWVAGSNRILHWDGATWTPMTVMFGPNKIWAISPTNVWASFGLGAAHWNGASWIGIPLGTNGEACTGVWAASATDVYLLTNANNIYRFDGLNATPTSLFTRVDANILALGGTSSTDAIAVGQYGQMLRWDGTAWRAFAPEGVIVPAERRSNAAVFAQTYDTAVVTGTRTLADGTVSNFVMHWDGNAWTDTSLDGGGLDAIWGASPTDVWFAGQAGRIYHGDGVNWTAVPNADTTDLASMWGSDGTNIWAVGGNRTLRYDGAGWSPVANAYSGSGVSFTAVSGTGRSDVWVGAAGGRFMHFDGTAWSAVASGTTSDVTALWGAAPNNFLAGIYTNSGFGSSARLLQWNGSTWTQTTVGGSALWGFSATNIWAGEWSGFTNADLEHWDGTSWTQTLQPGPGRISSLHGAGLTVWAVGDNAFVYRHLP